MDRTDKLLVGNGDADVGNIPNDDNQCIYCDYSSRTTFGVT